MKQKSYCIADNYTQPKLEELNEKFSLLSPAERIKSLYKYFTANEVLLTSSFGIKSAYLLHLISENADRQQVTFIDTTYHFPETMYYKNILTKRFNLEVVDISPDPIQNRLTTEESWWIDHPNMCCTVNKIAPIDGIASKYKVWISGLMGFQNEHRSRKKIFENRGDIIKFYPLIDLDEGEFLYHISFNQFPKHPLEEQGYGSVGCIHCTEKGEGRSGRWKARNKSECGLHTSYYYKK